jgi:hypothetical protein
MGIQRRARRVASGAGVVLATTGLSTCRDGGAVDPPPPPFACTNDVSDGQVLQAAAALTGSALRVIIQNGSLSTWTAVEVSEVVGGVTRSVALPSAGEALVVNIDLTDDTVKSGSFRLSGTLRGFNSSAVCSVSRTFAFTVQSSGVFVAVAQELPLPERRAARIVLLSREGREVELAAVTGFEGTQAFSWTVTGGEVLALEGHRLRWRMPARTGLYQVDVVVDYGSRGLSFDALTLEVV